MDYTLINSFIDGIKKAENDPDDTLFLQLTQRESAFIALGTLCIMPAMSALGLGDEVRMMSSKFIEAIEAQKPGTSHWAKNEEE